MKNDEDSQAFSIEKFAERWDICRQTVYKEINDGHLQTIKIRSRRVIPRQAEEKWLQNKKNVA